MLLMLKSYTHVLANWVSQNQLVWLHFSRMVRKSASKQKPWKQLIKLIICCYWKTIKGGRSQPGCSRWDIVGICDHQRAYEYYIESINRPEFYALQCNSFDKLKKGNCTVVSGMVRMGGEPGNKKYVKRTKFLIIIKR